MTMELSPAGRRYGYNRAPSDHRDFSISRLRLTDSLLPRAVDLEEHFGPVKDQGSKGECTAFAGCGNREYLARKFGNWAPIFSPQALYYLERREDGTLPDDAGSDGRTSCRVMRQFGLLMESEFPYGDATWNLPPSAELMDKALLRRAGAYHRVNNVEDIKSCLASGYPVLLGFAVYEPFEGIGPSGQLPAEEWRKGRLLGGHEVLAAGYDDGLGAFKIRNSWGAVWGASGNFWMPYSVAADSSVLWDAWMQHLGSPWSVKLAVNP